MSLTGTWGSDMNYTLRRKIMFKDCDPAGIVFFPRYFEMVNDCAESFFDEVLHSPYAEMHQGGGVPSAAVSAEFKAPSRLGEVIEIALSIATSLTLAYRVTGPDAGLRLTARQTLVHVNDSLRPTRWPEALRARLTKYSEET